MPIKKSDDFQGVSKIVFSTDKALPLLAAVSGR